MRLGADVCKCCFHGFHPSPFPLQTQTSWGPLYAVCCMLYAVSVRLSPPRRCCARRAVICELVLFAWFPSIPIPALANDVLGFRCVLMLYACCLQGFRPSLESCKLSRRRSLWRWCVLCTPRRNYCTGLDVEQTTWLKVNPHCNHCTGIRCKTLANLAVEEGNLRTPIIPIRTLSCLFLGCVSSAQSKNIDQILHNKIQNSAWYSGPS